MRKWTRVRDRAVPTPPYVRTRHCAAAPSPLLPLPCRLHALLHVAHRRFTCRRAVVDQAAGILLLGADVLRHADVLISVIVGDHDWTVANDLAIHLLTGGAPTPSPLCLGCALDCTSRRRVAQGSVRGDELAFLHLFAHSVPAYRTVGVGTTLDLVVHATSPRRLFWNNTHIRAWPARVQHLFRHPAEALGNEHTVLVGEVAVAPRICAVHPRGNACLAPMGSEGVSLALPIRKRIEHKTDTGIWRRGKEHLASCWGSASQK
mmetsp:Transcript_3884/g.11559  ORF Transcript_3884/g.11559 Transcript_3884/m.11559 type:complete len:262 (+) Transcript_3884:157-942(+)